MKKSLKIPLCFSVSSLWNSVLSIYFTEKHREDTEKHRGKNYNIYLLKAPLI